jgi:hypothetical protein
MFSRRFLHVVVLSFVTMALAISAQAASFSQASLKGSYSFSENKWTTDPGAHQFGMVGVMRFDGAGNVTGSATTVANGVSSTGDLGGTYTVNSNGTGVIDITTIFLSSGEEQYAITLNSAVGGVAQGFQFIETLNAVYLVTGTASLLSTTARNYSVASVYGTFAIQYNTLTADPDIYEEGGIGILTLDGKGNIKGSLTDKDSGGLHTPTLTGTYTVNSDGTCSISLVQPNSATVKLACALNSVAALGGAKGLQALVTNPGPSGADNSVNYIVIVTAVKQSVL